MLGVKNREFYENNKCIMSKMKFCLPKSFMDFCFQLVINQNMPPNNKKISQYVVILYFYTNRPMIIF
jgi:hypothetical protein